MAGKRTPPAESEGTGLIGRIQAWRNERARAKGKAMRRRASRSRAARSYTYYNDPISRPPVFGMVPMARKLSKEERAIQAGRKEVPQPFFPVVSDQAKARYNPMHGGVSFGPAPKGSFPVTMADAGLRYPQASSPGGRGPAVSFPVTMADAGLRYPQASGRMPRYDSACGARCDRLPRYRV